MSGASVLNSDCSVLHLESQPTLLFSAAQKAPGQLKSVIIERRVQMINANCTDLVATVKPYVFCEILGQLDV